MNRLSAPWLVLGTMTVAPAAHATGMQGHMYMAECAAEQATDPRLQAIVEGQRLRLQNGAFFPDSGYATDDKDQGEIPHWEQFVEGYIQQIRSRHAAPYDSPEAQADIAFLLGLAAHGITDSTFDPLLYDRIAQVDPGDSSSIDTAMDIFITADLPRFYVPDLDYDAALLSEVFAAVPHDVTSGEIDDAMTLGRAGIAAVSLVLYNGVEEWRADYPFAAGRFLDPRTPGGYRWGASVALRYYRQLLRRIDGDVAADALIIGAYPSAELPLVTLDHTRADSRILLLFGMGIDRNSIDGAVEVYDDSNNLVAVDVAPFRGDEWVNAMLITPQADWQSDTGYTIRISSTLTTLYGTNPSADIELTFTSCGDCDPYAGEPPPSPCPATDSMYLSAVAEPEAPEPPPPPAADSGCNVGLAGPRGHHLLAWAAMLLAGLMRRRHRASASGVVVSRQRRSGSE